MLDKIEGCDFECALLAQKMGKMSQTAPGDLGHLSAASVCQVGGFRNFGKRYGSRCPSLPKIKMKIGIPTCHLEIHLRRPDSGEHGNHSQPGREISSLAIDLKSRLTDPRSKKRFVTLY